MRVLILLLLSTTAWASGDCKGHSCNGGDIGQQEQSQTQAQTQTSSPTFNTQAGDSSVGDISTTIRSDYKRAPNVATRAPRPTALRQKCIGWGASTDDGSAVVGWCWTQRDEFALHRFEVLSGLGLFLPAAHAYCSQPLLRKDFDGQDTCEAEIWQSLFDASIPDDPEPIAEPAVDVEALLAIERQKQAIATAALEKRLRAAERRTADTYTVMQQQTASEQQQPVLVDNWAERAARLKSVRDDYHKVIPAEKRDE